MSLNRKASLLFLISVILFLSLSLGITFFVRDTNADLMFLLNSVAVSVPSFLIPAIVFRRKNHFPRSKAPTLGQLLIVFGIALGCLALNQALSYLTSIILSGTNVDSNSTTAETIMNLSGWNMLISLAIIPPLSEEFMMRGALVESWRRYSPVGAMILTSVLFALLHSAPSALIVYIGIGLVLAGVYLITRNVWLCVAVHFVNNIASVIAALLMKFTAGSSDAVEAAVAEAQEAIEIHPLILFIIYAGVACAFLIPLMRTLKKYCRERGLGIFAQVPETSPDYLPADGQLSAEGEEAAPGRASMWKDPILWLTILLLVLLNVFSGLMEFGVIKL